MEHKHWFVGMKIVCVRDLTKFIEGREDNLNYPKINEVYTIRNFYQYGKFLCVRLNEIHNLPYTYKCGHMEAFFGCNFFKPVHETNIDSLISICANPHIKIKETNEKVFFN